MEESKIIHIKRAKEARIRQRKQEISVFVERLARESYACCDLEGLDEQRWVETFPTKDFLYPLPSIASLIADDESPITEDIARSHQTEILADIKAHQMEVRRILVGRLAQTKARSKRVPTELDDGVNLHVNDIGPPDLDALQVEDKQNIALLLDPTTFFTSTYPNLKGQIWNYPDVLKPHSLIAVPTKEYPGIISSPSASTMAKTVLDASLYLANPEWDAKWRCDSSFVCFCCPRRLRRGCSWRELVRFH